MATNTIASVTAREILDSQGRPAVEVEVALASGTTGTSAARSTRGSSSPPREGHRVGDSLEFRGRAMAAAVEFVNTTVAREL